MNDCVFAEREIIQENNIAIRRTSIYVVERRPHTIGHFC